MKTSALRNKRVGILRMAFRAWKVLGTFEKRAPYLAIRIGQSAKRMLHFLQNWKLLLAKLTLNGKNGQLGHMKFSQYDGTDALFVEDWLTSLASSSRWKASIQS